MSVVPVVLFVYRRADHLTRILECLRTDAVPLLCIYSEAPASPAEAAAVDLVRKQVRAIDWTEVRLFENDNHRGLGASILSGVERSFNDFEAVVVLEDDLVFVPGTYRFLTAALQHYRDHPKVMSITGWTHPRVIPAGLDGRPYFDGRAECWSWAAWRKSWQGMERDAATMLHRARSIGVDIFRYGADLPRMARQERRRNTWASRWSLHHLINQTLCLRPPWSMVDHAPSSGLSTNVNSDATWMQELRGLAPPIPERWPEAVEHPEVAALWREFCGGRPSMFRSAAQSVRDRLEHLSLRW
jgi:hypothetical protein